MGFYNDFSETVQTTAKVIGKKSCEIAHYAKGAIEVSALKNKLSGEYEKRGRLISANKVVTDIVCSYESKSIKILNKIDKLKEQIYEKEQNKNKVKCSCGKYCEKDALYCSCCGNKLDK